jgi:hypothetical protein
LSRSEQAIVMGTASALTILLLGATATACSSQCSPTMTSIDLAFEPALSESVTADVVVGGQTLTIGCPALDTSVDGGAEYFCTDELLVLQISGLDLAATNMVKVSVTTSTGKVLTKDMSVVLGSIEADNSDETPGHCARAGDVTLM